MTHSNRLVVVSNRLPVVLQQGEEGWELEPGSGGLVSALAPVLSNRGGLWVGWPGLPVQPGGEWEQVLADGFREKGYDLAPVTLTEEEVEGFYRGFANRILWPLFHDMLSSCDFEPRFWYAYLDVNRKFARKVVDHTREDDFIWVQDYQLVHAAEAIRELDTDGARRRIGFFLHIPFPPLDIFLRLPWRDEILGALLAYDLIGFQTPRDRRNFLSCLEHLLPEAAVDNGKAVATVRLGERTIQVGAFPIGIDFKSFDGTARSRECSDRIESLRQKIGPCEIILGVDRLDYSKGLEERFHAFGNALERYPELREQVILLQIVVPSRETVPEYQALKESLDQLVGEINGKYSTAGWTPIHYHYRSIPRLDLVSLYRMARICFVSSLKDGMNLVAKEFCACQVDLDGTLVLSEFAGAASQLQEGAFLVNPHDVEGMADALRQGLDMDAATRRDCLERMRDVLEREDIFWWLRSYLDVALEGTAEPLPTSPEYLPGIDLQDAWVEV